MMSCQACVHHFTWHGCLHPQRKALLYVSWLGQRLLMEVHSDMPGCGLEGAGL